MIQGEPNDAPMLPTGTSVGEPAQWGQLDAASIANVRRRSDTRKTYGQH
jgi:hypothetical protein